MKLSWIIIHLTTIMCSARERLKCPIAHSLFQFRLLKEVNFYGFSSISPCFGWRKEERKFKRRNRVEIDFLPQLVTIENRRGKKMTRKKKLWDLAKDFPPSMNRKGMKNWNWECYCFLVVWIWGIKNYIINLKEKTIIL